jgi:FkbM family methyltransferase
MKKALQGLISRMGSRLPDRAWNLMLKTLIRDQDLLEKHGPRYLAEIATHLNISRISATGDYGTFSSSPNDETILKQYARTGKWASTTNDTLSAFFREGCGTYLDVGANIGLTVVPLASKTRVKCFAFEPEPTNFRNLQLNIAENCADKNVSAFQIALFDRKTSISFELSPNNLGDHRIRLNGADGGFQNEDTRTVIEVPCARLDDLNLEIAPPLFVKIDTQGAEPFVIAGGTTTLAKADAILLEWSPYHMKRMGGDINAVIRFLQANFHSGAIHDDPEAQHNDSLFRPIEEVCLTLNDSLTGWPDGKYVDIVVRR